MPYSDIRTGASASSSSPSSSSPPQQYGFICMSTVDDLSYTPSEQEKYRDEVQMAATGRRSWKTLKGKGEAVWPPVLEAALIEALEKYQPESSRSNKILGRFPMRNRFISDYIFETTEKRRTPKQVGSRLQQLRDTCKDPRILQLISRRASDMELLGTPSPPPGKGGRLVVYTDVAIEASPYISSPAVAIPIVELKHNDIASPFTTTEPQHTIVFPLSACSSDNFIVYKSSESVHQEIVPLRCTRAPSVGTGGQWFYITELSPNFWERLCDSSDPTKYTLLQNMTPAHPSADEFQQISVVYYFCYPEDTSEQQFSDHYTNSPQFSQHSASPQDPEPAYPNAHYMGDAGQYYCRQDSPNWESYPAAPQQAIYSRSEPSVPRGSAVDHSTAYSSHSFPSGVPFHPQQSSTWASNQHSVSSNYGSTYYP
ncbi:hypothetical protein BDQ17DRAFT_1541698 [Cyathus striatus]|nr:hypothetical protein BDQ17DRAFT_1541698 [Cyathus striatus]